MTIPYNEAGQKAFEVFYRVAEKLYANAQTATKQVHSAARNRPRECADANVLTQKNAVCRNRPHLTKSGQSEKNNALTRPHYTADSGDCQ